MKRFSTARHEYAQVEPRFGKYIFIEKSRKKTVELEKLREEFPDRRGRHRHRKGGGEFLPPEDVPGQIMEGPPAILFIDPFGMQLTWETVAAIGKTKAIDTWILFPITAVSRLLKRDGGIPAGWRRWFDTMFDESDWFEVFFPKQKAGLFGDDQAGLRRPPT